MDEPVERAVMANGGGDSHVAMAKTVKKAAVADGDSGDGHGLMANPVKSTEMANGDGHGKVSKPAKGAAKGAAMANGGSGDGHSTNPVKATAMANGTSKGGGSGRDANAPGSISGTRSLARGSAAAALLASGSAFAPGGWGGDGEGAERAAVER